MFAGKVYATPAADTHRAIERLALGCHRRGSLDGNPQEGVLSESLSRILKEAFLGLDSASPACKPRIEWHKFGGSKECILPRPIYGNEIQPGSVFAMLTSSPLSLHLYRPSLGDELVRVPFDCPTDSVLFIEPCISSQSLWFSFEPDAQPQSWLLCSSTVLLGSPARNALSLDQYFKQDAIASCAAVQERFVEDSFCQFQCMSDGQASRLVEALRACTPSMELAGPFDYRRYRILRGEGCCEYVQTFVQEAIGSSAFQHWISSITGLDLGGILSLEIRWVVGGDYQIINGDYSPPKGLDVVLTLAPAGDQSCPAPDGAAIFYIVDGEQAAKASPTHGTMSLAYRLDECDRFLCYLSKSSSLGLFQFVITFSVVE